MTNLGRVLVVDDQAINARALASLLRLQGHPATPVFSGEAALGFLKDHRTSVVVLDLTMPDMTGFDVMRAVRSDARLRDLPVVVYSSLDDAASRDEARRLGSRNYFVKGRDNISDLYDAVDRLSGEAESDGRRTC